jgi:tape measure domain-containing protein
VADETLNITVAEDNGATNKLVTAVNNLAQSSEQLADATDKSTASSRTASSARDAEAASTTKAATAAKGYIDAQGNYIRLVGSQATGVQTAAAAQGALTSSLSATSIEAGRAAAGYGPLNAGLSASQSAAAASRAAISELTAGLAGGATSAQAAGVGLNQVGAAGNAAAVGLANGRNAFRDTAAGAQTVNTAAQAAGAGLRAAGDGAGLAARGLVPVGTAARNAAAAATQAATSHQSLATAFRGVMGAASGLSGALAGVGLAIGAGKVIELADSYANVRNKLMLVTTDQAKLNQTMDVAFGIAQKTATPFNVIATTYGRIAQSQERYKLTTNEVVGATTALGYAIQQAGSSSAEAAAGLVQFGQGLDKGKFDAEDLKGVIERFPASQGAMIRGLKDIGVTVNGSLVEALGKGQVNVQQLIRGLSAAQPYLQELAANSLPTVAAATTRVSNAFEQYIGKTNESGSVTGGLINGLNTLAANMNIVVPIAAALAGVLAFGAVAAAVGSIVSLATAFAGLVVAATGAPLILAGIGAALAVGIPIWKNYGGTITEFAQKLLGIKPSADTAGQGVAAAGSQIASLGGQVQVGVQSVRSLNAEVDRTAAVLAKAKPGTAEYTAALAANTSAKNAAAAAASSLEKSRQALQIQTQANTQAEKDYNAAMDKIQTQNAYGEKLQTISDFLAKARAAQKAWQDSLDATMRPLDAMAIATNQAAIAATGFSESVAKAAAATQLGVSGFDQFGTEAANAARNLQALTGDAGLFTQAQLDANSSINQGQSAASSATGAISGLGAAYRQAGNDAEFFAIQSKAANTVAGQIGGSTASGLTSDWGGLALGGNIPTNSSPAEVIQIMTQRALDTLRTDPTNPSAIAYLSGQKSLREQAQAAVSGPGYKKPEYNDDGTLKTQTALNQSTGVNTSSTDRNTAAINANTAANNNVAADLPDLVAALDPRNSTTVTGLGANGRPTVGTSVTQVNYLTPPPAVANDTGPSPDVVAAQNGGFAPGVPRPDGAEVPFVRGPMGSSSDTSGAGQNFQTRGPSGPMNVSIVVKADDYGQFKRSDRQIAMDIGQRIASAGS